MDKNQLNKIGEKVSTLQQEFDSMYADLEAKNKELSDAKADMKAALEEYTVDKLEAEGDVSDSVLSHAGKKAVPAPDEAAEAVSEEPLEDTK